MSEKLDEVKWNKRQEIWKTLQNASFYHDVDVQMREGLQSIARVESHPHGKVLYETGDSADCCYIIIEGQISFGMKRPEKKRKTVILGQVAEANDDPPENISPYDAAGGDTKARQRALRIEILSAELDLGDSQRDLDPYVVGHLGSRKFQTPILSEGGGSPVWNHVVGSLPYTGDSAFDFEVMEHDKYSRNDILGTATIAIEAIHPEKGFFGELGLWKSRKKTEDHSLKPDAGILYVNIRWTDKSVSETTTADTAAKAAGSPSVAAPPTDDAQAGSDPAISSAPSAGSAAIRSSISSGGLGALVSAATGTARATTGASAILSQHRASLQRSSKDRVRDGHLGDPIFDELLPPFPVLVCESGGKEPLPTAPTMPSIESHVLQALEASDTSAGYAHLGPGKVFGELALFREGPRGVTARCEMPSKLLVIDKIQFQRLVADQVERQWIKKENFVVEHIPGMISLLPRGRERVHLFFRRRIVPHSHVILKQGAQASKQVLFVVSRGCVELTWQQQLGVSSGGVQMSKGSPEVRMGILAKGQMFGSSTNGVEPFTAIAAGEGCEVLQVLGRDFQRLPSLVQERIRNQLNSSAKFHLQHAQKAVKISTGATQSAGVDTNNAKGEQNLHDGLGPADAVDEVDALNDIENENTSGTNPLRLLKESPFLSTKRDFDYELVAQLQQTFPYYKPSSCKQFPKSSTHEIKSQRSSSYLPEAEVSQEATCKPRKKLATEQYDIVDAELHRAIDPLAEECKKAMQRRQERALPVASGRSKAEQEIRHQTPVRTVLSAPSNSGKTVAMQRPGSQGFKAHPAGVALPRYHLLKPSSSSPALGCKSTLTSGSASSFGSSKLREISRQHANKPEWLLTPLLEGLQLGVRQTHGLTVLKKGSS